MTQTLTYYSIRYATAYGGVRVRAMVAVSNLRLRNLGPIVRWLSAR